MSLKQCRTQTIIKITNKYMRLSHPLRTRKLKKNIINQTYSSVTRNYINTRYEINAKDGSSDGRTRPGLACRHQTLQRLQEPPGLAARAELLNARRHRGQGLARFLRDLACPSASQCCEMRHMIGLCSRPVLAYGRETPRGR